MKKLKVKEAFLGELRKVPIVQVACERVNISRNSIYRWRNDDPKFRAEMDEALTEGDALVSDMSESQLLTLIKEKNWQAISFWLRHRSPRFRDSMDVSVKTAKEEPELTPEQKKIIRKALNTARLKKYKHE